MRPPVLRQSGRGDIARGTIISGETQLVNPSPEQRAERRTNVINYGRKGGGKTRTEPSQSRGLPTVTPWTGAKPGPAEANHSRPVSWASLAAQQRGNFDMPPTRSRC